ncbi:hypothetical protein M378DRAFT_1065728 [Amanita muscaria Koide BX008]|uniref:Uncharacterized protein n=1 Tax=Amanita muscaria (strain Koide BX008) TaxID=946122 RepID=A0A0C2XE48_AMAMK|nr:hypothetical protein M378DRAFT_1065728 [Amanita muscaria Koide BX008]
MKDPEPQVIAEAIAAFALNNRKRERDLNLPPCDSIHAGLLQIYHHCRTEQSRSDRHLSRDRNPCPSLHPCPSSQEQRRDAPSAQQT